MLSCRGYQLQHYGGKQIKVGSNRSFEIICVLVHTIKRITTIVGGIIINLNCEQKSVQTSAEIAGITECLTWKSSEPINGADMSAVYMRERSKPTRCSNNIREVYAFFFFFWGDRGI